MEIEDDGMTHYICTGGCEGVSATPGSCQADDCPHHRRALQSCDCTDGSHDGEFTGKDDGNASGDA